MAKGVNIVIGPGTFTYFGLVAILGQTIAAPRPILHVHTWLGHLVGKAIGFAIGVVFISEDEIAGLMENLLYVDSAPAG